LAGLRRNCVDGTPAMKFSMIQGENISTSPLDRLVLLCSEFDAACKKSATSDQSSAESLVELDDYLWSLTNELCEEIEKAPPSSLIEFHSSHFQPKVLNWCKLHPAISALWAKPAGYSGDFRTIELICNNQRSWARFEDIFR
jgi:hypothetical protein